MLDVSLNQETREFEVAQNRVYVIAQPNNPISSALRDRTGLFKPDAKYRLGFWSHNLLFYRQESAA
jgi:hypothetical protein